MTCRICGCNDFNACMTPDGPCCWVEPGLCSACQERALEFTLPGEPLPVGYVETESGLVVPGLFGG